MATTSWTSLSEMDPELKPILANAPPMPELTADIPIALLRGAMQMIENVPGVSTPASMAGVKKSTIAIPVRDGSSIPALLYQSEDTPRTGSPLFAVYHGGGWFAGRPDLEEVNCVNAVQRFGAVAVSVDYRLAPEHPFPVPVEDSWDALQWIAANAEQLGADPSQGFIVHGESAGGNIASIITLLARDHKLSPSLTGISLSIPVLLRENVVPERFKSQYLSMEQNKDAPGLNAAAITYMIGLYNPVVDSPLLSPFIWPTGHRDLPPVHFQICGLDPLRDEGLLYEQLLREECGVRTKLVVYPGLPHSFWAMTPQLSTSGKAIEKTVEGFGWLLDGGQ